MGVLRSGLGEGGAYRRKFRVTEIKAFVLKIVSKSLITCTAIIYYHSKQIFLSFHWPRAHLANCL